MTTDLEQIYQQQLRELSPEGRLRLIAMLARDLAVPAAQPGAGEKHATHSLLELEGLGAEIWEGIDARGYVDQLRREWDHRP